MAKKKDEKGVVRSTLGDVGDKLREHVVGLIVGGVLAVATVILGALRGWLRGLPELWRGTLYGAVGLLALGLLLFAGYALYLQRRQRQRPAEASQATLPDPSLFVTTARALSCDVSVGGFWRVSNDLKIVVVGLDRYGTNDPEQRALLEAAGWSGSPHAEIRIEGHAIVYHGGRVTEATTDEVLLLPSRHLFLPVCQMGESQEPCSIYFARFGAGHLSAFMAYIDHINPNSQVVSFKGCVVGNLPMQQPGPPVAPASSKASEQVRPSSPGVILSPECIQVKL